MRLFWILSALLMVASLSFAGDWPGFLGPNRDGVSPEKGLATSWPEDGPKELWSFKLGVGYAGAAVKDGKVYVPDRQGDQKDVLHCLDLAKGTELWSVSSDAPGKVNYPGSRATPAVDDNFVFTMGPLGNFYCIDLKTHKIVWQKSVTKDFGAGVPMWAVAASPLLYKDWVILAPQGKAGLAALNRKTGKPAWTSQAIGGMSYASPMITTIDKVEQVVMISDKSIVGADVKTGNILWRFESWKCQFPIASITAIGDGRLFVTSIKSPPYSSNSVMFRPKLQGGKWSVKEEFKTLDLQSQLPNALLYGKHLYANSAASGKGLVCMDLDGKIMWNKAGLNDTGGELVIAQDMIYMMNGSNGTLYLIQASPEEYKELASAKVLEGAQVWAPLAIADGKLLCRDQKRMKCLDISGK
jgi:outer membrane protein assembly factor BamB